MICEYEDFRCKFSLMLSSITKGFVHFGIDNSAKHLGRYVITNFILVIVIEDSSMKIVKPLIN